MWQEARKQEKHIKTLMVDYRKRAERRRDYYERIKQDPIKFLRVYGRPSKLHLDSETVKAAENPNNMMSWIGDSSILIDRFDARANLEHWDYQLAEEPKLTPVERIENRLCMYERYRCLIHNDYAGVSEMMALKQIECDEKFGDLDKKRKEEEEVGKKSQEPKAAIGFVYEDSTAPISHSTSPPTPPEPAAATEDSESDGEADSDMDIDVELDLATLGVDGRRQLAQSAATFGLHPTDFVRLLNADQQLETELRLAKALEEEKLQLAGRKSRRARRLLKERRAKERFPKMLTTKVGLLNGQPISRRTVYLSASSSDSGDYPSDETEDVSLLQSRNSKAADVRARRARAKPMLTNARGPSVLIGGMTSISLCRRRSNAGLDTGEKMRKAGARSTSSSRSSDSSTNRRRDSSSSSDRSRRGRRLRGGDGRHRGKRSRVEYITTFGDNDDDRADVSRKSNTLAPVSSGVLWKDEKPSTATSAMAASVVSKLLYSSKNDTSVGRLDSSSTTRYVHREARNRSSSSGSYRRRNRRSPVRRYRSPSSHSSSSKSSGPTRRRGRRRSSGSSSSRSWSHARGRNSAKRVRRSPSRSNSLHRSFSRSPLSQRLSSSGPNCNRRDNRPSPDASRHPLENTGMNPPRNDTASPPPVRKRYYRPELESEEESVVSGEGSEPESATSFAVGSRQSDASGTSASAGKMATSSHTEGGSLSNLTKSISGSAPADGMHLTPQELLKRRVQLQLTKAFNADKQAELEKQLQLEKERQAREEGLRRQAQLIRRQEEKRLREENRIRGAAAGNSSDASSSSGSPVDRPPSRSRPLSQRSPPRRSRTFGPRKSPSTPVRHTPSRSPSPITTNRLPSPPSHSIPTKFQHRDYRSQQSGRSFSTRPSRARNFHPDRGCFPPDRGRFSSISDRHPSFDRPSHTHHGWTSPPHWTNAQYRSDHHGGRGPPWTPSDGRRFPGRNQPWPTSGSRTTPSARDYRGRYS